MDADLHRHDGRGPAEGSTAMSVVFDPSAPPCNRHGGRRPAIHAFVSHAKGVDADLRLCPGLAQVSA